MKPSLLLALVLAAAPALAAPPPGSDPNSPTAQWFRSLERPDFGGSCCDLSDGRPTTIRYTRDKDGNRQLEATTPDGTWVIVPESKIIYRPPTPNPTGHDLLFWLPNVGVMCFVFGVQS